MRFPWQRRFHDLIQTQLHLFEQEYGHLVVDARKARDAYNEETDEKLSMELHERFDDCAEDVEDALEEMCNRMASTMELKAARKYRSQFEQAARDRYSDLLPRLRFGGWDPE